MRAGLICPDTTRAVLAELLHARSIDIDSQADVYIVEAGSELPKGKLSIVFEWNYVSGLLELLERLTKTSEDSIDTIVGKSGEDSYEVIPITRIYFFEARGNNAYGMTADKEFKVREKLYELEARLPQNRFIRVGKSFIVNIGNVKEIIPWFGRRLVLKFVDSKKEIEVSKNYVKSFKEFLGM